MFQDSMGNYMGLKKQKAFVLMVGPSKFLLAPDMAKDVGRLDMKTQQ